MVDWLHGGVTLHTVEMASIAVLIEAFSNARLAREEHLRVQTCLAAAHRTGAPLAVTHALAGEAACWQVRAEQLVAEAEKLLPSRQTTALGSHASATLMQ